MHQVVWNKQQKIDKYLKVGGVLTGNKGQGISIIEIFSSQTTLRSIIGVDIFNAIHVDVMNR